MKKTPLKRIGKWGEINKKANKELKKKYEEAGITRCEYPFCNTDMFLTFAHRHKRVHYRKPENAEKLADINETLLLCQKHHDEIEVSREKTKELFNRLRPIYE